NNNTGSNVQITAPSGSGSGVSDKFENNGTDWTGRGTVKYGFVSDFVHGGSKALYVTDRTASWHGVAVSSDELKAGGTYNISAFVGYNSNQYSTADFSMGLQYDLNGETKYDAVADAKCSSGKWSELASDFSIPSGATAISLYVQSAYTETPTEADILPFYLDDVTFTVKSSGNNNSGNNNNNNNNSGNTVNNGITDYGTPMSTSATMTADFRKGATPLFFASDGWENGDPFDCGWYEKNTSLANNMLSLTIDKDYTGKYNYSGAEYRTADHYHYGYYETSMQAIKNDGVVSSFFTYTGPSEDNPWDEIDIEILGKDTTKVQLNYYTNGVGNHEYMYDLGFDASEGFHTYGFDWQPDHITWYVDGKAVYTAYSNIPQTPGRIMMNAWPGRGVNEWLNAFNGKTPLTARYQWVTYTKK
ncbi:MAG: family 16 glycosylhydrolase, partial [Ruminococcus sp.]|nr:family 16 glycosylhydrolase [Ruminococcus sp.]